MVESEGSLHDGSVSGRTADLASLGESSLNVDDRSQATEVS